MILLTPRSDGGVQGSPVTAGVDGEGRILVATYPERAKAVNVAKHGTATVIVLSDDFGGPWVQVTNSRSRERRGMMGIREQLQDLKREMRRPGSLAGPAEPPPLHRAHCGNDTTTTEGTEQARAQHGLRDRG